MIIASRLIRDRARGLRWWALGIVFGVATTVALYPTIKGQAQLEDLLRDLPTGVQAVLGSDVTIPITSAPGYLQARLFSTLLPVVLIVYAVSLGTRVIGSAEEDGTLQLLVTSPVTRRALALQRLAGAVLLLVGLGLVALVTALVVAAPTGALQEVGAGRIAVATLAVTLLGVLHLAVSFAVGAATGRRVPAIAVGSGLAVGGYLIHGLAASSEVIRPARALSPFWWASERNLLVQGPTFLSHGLPLTVAVAATVIGVALYERDLHFP